MKNDNIKKNIDEIISFIENKNVDNNKIEDSKFDSKMFFLGLDYNFNNSDYEFIKNDTTTIRDNLQNYKLISKVDELCLKFKVYITKINNIPCLYFKNFNNEENKVLIFYHGNTEDIINILYCKENSTILHALIGLENNYDVIIPELPGYYLYKSKDRSEEKIIKDTEEIYNKIKNIYDKITILGFSIGCYSAINLASYENSSKINMLILMHPFLNIKTAAKHICCCACCVKKRFRNDKNIEKVKCRTAILSASEDQVISCKDAFGLYNILQNNNINVNLYKYTSFHGLPDLERLYTILKKDEI